MISELWKRIKKYRETLAYLIFGALTVAVNTALFLIMDWFLKNELLSNTIAFFLSVQFAYVTNTKFVFQCKFTKRNFLQFWTMRIGTILIDNGGMWLLLAIGVHKIGAKCAVNALIIVLNYLFSKFLIYKKGKEQ